MQNRRKAWAGALLGGVAALLTIAAAGLIVVHMGAYNVAALEGHTPFMRWALETTMRNSVRSRADGLTPPQFTAADLREGALEFAEYCVHCHGAPGERPHEWTSGMVPNPRDLARAAEEWNTAEIFWIAKHGIKMTGMPPFGDGHDDRTIWSIAAFVDRLPGMTPEQYRAATDRDEGVASGESTDSGHTH